MHRRIAITLLSAILLGSCKPESRIDLSTLHLNEQVKDLVRWKSKGITVGMSTVEVPDAMILTNAVTDSYSFNNIPLDSATVIFKLTSPAYRKKIQALMHGGGGHMEMERVSNADELSAMLKKEQADGTINGCLIEMTDAQLPVIRNTLTGLYGQGIKNPNTTNGLYWKLDKENKLILLAPDYHFLILLNTTGISKTCYWDAMNGMLDLGGCNSEEYMKHLFD